MSPAPDREKFRLRGFLDRLIELGEVEIHDEPVSLAALSSHIEATGKALLFRRAGPEGFEMVASVCGSRKRLAAAFGVGERDLAPELMRRLAVPQAVVEIASSDAPVHAVVQTGDAVDLTRLPFHLQHALDGAPYLSAAIDYAVDPETGKTNVGCRRLMLRNRTTLRSNLSQPSDLQQIYKNCVARGQTLPVSFVVGAHPLDYLAASLRLPGDEFGMVASLRGAPMPMVRGVTNGVLAPADAELIIEGYFDEKGYVEQEGPYGEFWGFYGPVHADPVFHVTAITSRRDVLHQTVLHSGRFLSRSESTNLVAIITEMAAWRALGAAGIEPVAVQAMPGTNGGAHMRLSLKRGSPGQARLAISAIFSLRRVKHVFVVDEDVDIFSDEEMEWTMSTRFRADRDLMVADHCPAFYADPVADKDGMVAKMGFDLTAPYGGPDGIEQRRPRAAASSPARRWESVRDALAEGPKFFAELMQGLGSEDGREIALALDALRAEGMLARNEDGAWILKAR
jgi:2,5-furandicarboxylate decarboxylase 1